MDNFPKHRSAAIETGQRYFCTERPCRNGHISPRYSKNGDCVRCAKERAASWKGKNREAYNARSKELYAASGDVARAKAAKRSKKYWMANAELILEKQRLKYLNDPEKCRANARDWRNRNIDAAREKNREWAKENRDRMRVSAKEWRARNVDHVREKSREAYARNKEAYKARARNRKARKKNAEGHHTSADIERIRLAQRNKCAICKEVLVKATTHVDHILPLSKGGSNWPKNLQLLCKSCNLKKWSCDPIEFMQEAGFLL